MTYRRRPSSQPYPLGLMVAVSVLGMPALAAVLLIIALFVGFLIGGWPMVMEMWGSL
jgi:hypothetical protein